MILIYVLIGSIILNIVLAAYNRYLDREITKTQNRIAHLEHCVERAPSEYPVHDR